MMLFRPTVLLPLLLFPFGAGADFIGDPVTFELNLESDGTFGELTLANTSLDSLFPQQQFANGEAFIDGGTVTVLSPNQASYTAYIGDSGATDPFAHVFQVDVLSTILSPMDLPGVPNGFFEQQFTFTNLTQSALSIESVAFYLSDLNNDQDYDIVQQDGTRPVVFGADGPSGQLVALSALAGPYEIRWQTGQEFDIYDLDPPRTDLLTDNTGPFATTPSALVEMAVGLDAGVVNPGAEVNLTYRYLFAINLSEPPAAFPLPAPGSLALVGLGLAGFLGFRPRRHSTAA